MSGTRVTEEEWGTLRVVQRASFAVCNMGPCDIQPSHGLSHILLATPDNRALAPCDGCYHKRIRMENPELPRDIYAL